jgi:hypothetical protein
MAWAEKSGSANAAANTARMSMAGFTRTTKTQRVVFWNHKLIPRGIRVEHDLLFSQSFITKQFPPKISTVLPFSP